MAKTYRVEIGVFADGYGQSVQSRWFRKRIDAVAIAQQMALTGLTVRVIEAEAQVVWQDGKNRDGAEPNSAPYPWVLANV